MSECGVTGGMTDRNCRMTKGNIFGGTSTQYKYIQAVARASTGSERG